MIRRCRPILVATATAALLLTGCSSNAVDIADLESGIQLKLEEQEPDSVQSVDCPEGLEIAQGSTFQCTVVDAEGKPVVATGTWVDDEGNYEMDVPAS